MEKIANYTAAQVAIIAAFAGTGTDGKLNFTDATTIAAMPEMVDADGNARKPRAIVAKIVRDGFPYEKAVPVRKDGAKVETKAAIAAEIAARVGVALDGLESAPRPALVALRNWALAA